MNETSPGTTKRKRSVKPKPEEPTCAAQSDNDKQIAKLLKRGGRILEIHWYRGRFHDWHRVLVTKEGQVFFPDHHMCDCDTLLAELDLREAATHKYEVDLFPDACYAFALYMCRSDDLRLRSFPIAGNCRYRSYNRKYKTGLPDSMTTEQEKWFKPVTLGHLQMIRDKRNERVVHGRKIQEPVLRAISFTKSMRKRIERIETDRVAAFRRKMQRVEDKLKKKFGPQLDYHDF